MAKLRRRSVKFRASQDSISGQPFYQLSDSRQEIISPVARHLGREFLATSSHEICAVNSLIGNA